MNQRDGFYQVDTERNVNPYRIIDPLIAAIFVGVVVALLKGWL